MTGETLCQAPVPWNDLTGLLRISVEYEPGTWPVDVVTSIELGREQAQFTVSVSAEGDLALAMPDVTPFTRCLNRCGLGPVVNLVLAARSLAAKSPSNGSFVEIMRQNIDWVEFDLVACVPRCLEHPHHLP